MEMTPKTKNRIEELQRKFFPGMTLRMPAPAPVAGAPPGTFQVGDSVQIVSAGTPPDQSRGKITQLRPGFAHVDMDHLPAEKQGNRYVPLGFLAKV